MTVYHVIPHPGRGWAVKRSDATRRSRTGFETRHAALRWACGRRRVDEVVVHDRTGRIAWVERTPSGDVP